ncbi:Polyamine transporter RMV1 [Phytophthora citrophthora]|uniref:Polyamine transporter RMV1 n=1 Tax=Phytophthora citrophthora TaxID=4793 RepID=A0AAD9LHA9_9STRA|nr:Polyamine transporter RMV1 [Phytophthora citrophthora]
MLEEDGKNAVPNTSYAPDTTPAGPFVLGNFDNKMDTIEPSPSLYDRRQALAVNHRRLGVVGIVSILYVYLCAGPIGSEAIVSAGGPLVGVVGVLLYALLVAFPFAYIVAELCTAFPEDGGFTVWTLNAFGPFWAFQVGYWSWVAGVLRGALMPGTLLGLLTRYYNIEIKSSAVAYFIKAAIGIILAIPTFLGSRTVGRLSIVVTIVVIFCFSVFTIWAVVKTSDVDDLFQIRREHVEYDVDAKDVVSTGDVAIQWTTLLNTLFFKFKGINNASVFGGEVKNPAHSYSRAIAYTCLLILATYIIPMTAGIVSDALPWFLLDRDSFPFFAYYVGGRFLRTLIQIASCCGSAGMCMAALHAKTFLVSGMAENRLVPKVLAKRSIKYQSPRNAALLTVVLMLALINLDFDSMLTMTNAYSAAVQLVIIASIIKLRRELPYIARPTKVPGGIPVLFAMAVAPTFMFGYITFYALCNMTSAILMVVFFVPGVAYAGYRFYYRRSLA